jgi:DNA-directed RNA polymerase I, II, and III subunit RPABC2
MSDNESDYYDSDSNNESDEESVDNVVLTKKPIKPIAINHAKQFGGYEEDDSVADDSEPENDDDEKDIDEIQIGGVEDDPEDYYSVSDEEKDDSEEDEEDIEIDEDGEAIEKQPSSVAKTVKPKKSTQLIIEDEEEEEDEFDENYLQKFDTEINKNYIYDFHPECLNHNSDEIEKLARVVRDENNIIIDSLHRTIPYLTKYEKARILGQRAKQIEVGAKPLVKVPENIIDSYIIAELELREKKIPFIIKRPIPGGAFEYWHLRDLENIVF